MCNREIYGEKREEGTLLLSFFFFFLVYDARIHDRIEEGVQRERVEEEREKAEDMEVKW